MEQSPANAESLTEFQRGYQEQVDPNLVAHQLDPSPVLNPLEEFWKQNKVMNEDGIRTIISKILIRFNHYTSLSNLDDETIWKFKEECEHDTNEMLFKQGPLWDLNPAYYDSIITDVGQAILFGMNRALGQGERKFLAKTFESKQVYQEKEKRPKIFGKFV